jgi:hypothetical protein
MLKTAHDAEEFMRTGARVSPSWPGGDLRGRIRCSRLISRRSRQNPLQTGRAIRFQHNRPDFGPSRGDPYRRALRPIEASKAAIRNGCFTSTPVASCAPTADRRHESIGEPGCYD